MSLTPQLRLKQKQTLKLTQSMRQSIEVMQLDRDEIEALIQKEKEENPLLELDTEHDVVDIEEQPTNNKELSEGLSSKEATEALDKDSDFDNEFDDSYNYHRSNYSADAGSVIEATASFKESIYEQLSNQIRLNFKKPSERAIAQFWLTQLDESGRLSEKYFNHAKNHGLSHDDLEFLLGRLQQLEPVGLFARNLKECFKAQLIDTEEWDLTWLTIFDNMDMLVKGQIKSLQRYLHIPKDIFLTRMKRLKELSPNPAWQGEQITERAIIAELRVYRDIVGALQIELNDEAFSDIIMHAIETNQSQSLKQNDWIKSKKEKGLLLTKILARRAESILKIGKILIQKQVMFFEKDTRYLSPLTMSSIATELNVHESTISRLVRGKYLEFQGQTIELRWFFQAGGIKTKYGSDVSAVSVQEHIKSIISDEPKQKPYSDDTLVEILKEKYGLKIARRTVAKYREMSDISSSIQRKKQYLNQF